jgi:malonyl-CoA O-methyltransferase
MNITMPLSLISLLRQQMQRHRRHYRHAAFLAQEIGSRMLERLAMIKIQPACIVDMGAGPGHFAQQLQQRYPQAQVIAVDITETILPRAKWWQRWRKQPRPLAADAHQLPLASQSVDLIFCNFMLYQSWDMPQLFQEWRRILKPHGLVLFSSLGPDTLKEFRLACAHVDNTPRVQTFIDMHDIGDLLLKTQFADPVMDMEYLTVYYQKFTALLRDIQHAGMGMPIKENSHFPGKNYWLRVAEYYQTLCQDEQLPVTCEVIYGHAWAPERVSFRVEQGEVSIPISHLLKTKKQ